MLFSFFLETGFVFSALAAIVAFLITYQEFRRHHFEGWKLWRESLVRAAFTFAIFFALSIAIGLFI